MSEQAWNFFKKETPAQVFFCDFYEIFLEHVFIEHFHVPSLLLWLESPIFEIFFILTYPMFIYLSFESFRISFCSTYRVIMIMQIVLTITKFVLCQSLPPTIIFITFWDFLMFYPIFLLQVKRSAISSYKDGTYELPSKLPNDSRVKILRN